MNIKIIQGCTAYNTLINDTPVADYGELKLIDELLPKIKEGIQNGTISINNVIELFQYDSFEQEEESCETCGDSVSTTIYNI